MLLFPLFDSYTLFQIGSSNLDGVGMGTYDKLVNCIQLFSHLSLHILLMFHRCSCMSVFVFVKLHHN